MTKEEQTQSILVQSMQTFANAPPSALLGCLGDSSGPSCRVLLCRAYVLVAKPSIVLHVSVIVSIQLQSEGFHVEVW